MDTVNPECTLCQNSYLDLNNNDCSPLKKSDIV